MSALRTAAVLFVALVVLPGVLHACPVCFDPRDENRAAFFATTIFLSLLPLGLVAGLVVWLRHRARLLQAASEPAAHEP